MSLPAGRFLKAARGHTPPKESIGKFLKTPHGHTPSKESIPTGWEIS